MTDYLKRFPDSQGYFGEYGGAFIPPELQAEMDQISDGYY
jgi:tryptophan synthase beta chain